MSRSPKTIITFVPASSLVKASSVVNCEPCTTTHEFFFKPLARKSRISVGKRPWTNESWRVLLAFGHILLTGGHARTKGCLVWFLRLAVFLGPEGRRGVSALIEHRRQDDWTYTPCTCGRSGCSGGCDVLAGERLPKQRPQGEEHPEHKT